MNFEIFDETYYLAKYPDLKAAKDAGLISSGLAHFQQFGRKEGRTLVSPYYDEAYYLANNPGVGDAVKAGILASGLDHLIQFGYDEGRTRLSPYYDESFYLKANPDITAVVQQGQFKSGLQHFIKFGAKEGRYATNFLEPKYLQDYPDIAAAIRAGIVGSGTEHYFKWGQFEGRKATFVGTREQDRVTAFGVGEITITGVEVGWVNGNLVYESRGEIDTLVGSPGSDTFVLGDRAAYIDSSGKLQPPSLITFYGGYTLFPNIPLVNILNFDPTKDYIQLPGTTIDYNFYVGDNAAEIYYSPIVSGYESAYKVGTIVGNNLSNTFQNWIKYLIPAPPFEQNFLDPLYLVRNPDVRAAVAAGSFTSGLDHYRQFGQFEPSRTAVFSGTRGNDIVTAFGVGQTEISGVERVYSEFSKKIDYKSRGENEFDTLIGSNGSDIFLMSDLVPARRPFYRLPISFYDGVGEARIQEFNQSQGDKIRLIGRIDNYQILPSGSDLIISKRGDIIAIIEGGAGLTLTSKQDDFYTFDLG